MPNRAGLVLGDRRRPISHRRLASPNRPPLVLHAQAHLCLDLLLGALYTALGHYEPPFLAVAIKCLDSVANAPANDVGEEKWVVPFATWHRAVVELKVGDVETADVQTDAAKARGLWKPRLDRAERLLDSLTTAGEYDLKTRVSLLSFFSPRTIQRGGVVAQGLMFNLHPPGSWNRAF